MSYNLHIFDYDIKTKLEEKYGKTVTVRNDGKCAALVEKTYGSLKDYDDALFLNIGTGIGGAAFLGGKLLEPKKYSGFEFGHMTLVKDGIECTCGKKGCFERYCSIKSLKARVVKTLNLPNDDFSGQYMREYYMVNEWGAIWTDVIDFSTQIQNWVEQKFWVLLEPEAIFVK